MVDEKVAKCTLRCRLGQRGLTGSNFCSVLNDDPHVIVQSRTCVTSKSDKYSIENVVKRRRGLCSKNKWKVRSGP